MKQLDVFIIRWHPIDPRGRVSGHTEIRSFTDKALAERYLEILKTKTSTHTLHSTCGLDHHDYEIAESEEDFEW